LFLSICLKNYSLKRYQTATVYRLSIFDLQILMDITQLLGLTALVFVAGLVGLFTLPYKYRSILTLSVVLINSVLTIIPAISALTQGTQTGQFVLPHLFTNVAVKVDSLAAWFILIINLTTINGALFGRGYLKAYTHMKVNREIHWVFFMLLHVSMLWVCMFDNGFAFLVAWEFMAISALMLTIFEFEKKETIRVGLNYLVQTHMSVEFLIVGFIWLFQLTGSFNFSSLAGLTPGNNSIWVFILLFIGFAIKAGFVPFHTWLPKAHPAAPSHISGVMSGVIVKLGIYGIIRTISYLRFDWLLMGELLLILSVTTALYGIANAAVKNDFKRMLAFCTIENIGLIGMGIGLALIGIGTHNETLLLLGMTAALLHTLNHSLFKSLLFFSAGSVYLQTHTRNIERLGGLMKKMPVTAAFFLIGSLAIGALPPFNGFVSEYLIYAGLFNGLNNISSISQVVLMILAIGGLSIVGGISLLTFTKTFGIAFLGNARKELTHKPTEMPFSMHLPQYIIVGVMMSIAIFPQFYLSWAIKVTMATFPGLGINHVVPIEQMGNNMAVIGQVSLLFIGVLAGLLGVRWLLVRKRDTVEYETWGCGYVAPVAKAQYTGRSFAHPFGNLFSFVLKKRKTYKKLPKEDLYPETRTYSTNYFDVVDKYLILPLARRSKFFLNYFQFIQNGQIQSYVIYGLFFILLIFIGTALGLIN
jgi:hydrogenase-4 component B